MVVVPLERENLVIAAGLEEGHQGASLCHFSPGVDVADSPELAADMVALNPVIAVAAGAEESRREAVTRHFVDVRGAANAPERVAEPILVPPEHLLFREKQDAKHQRQSTRGLVVPDVAVLA
jgi:hypothetical protein